jgi:hypothetical protein
MHSRSSFFDLSRLPVLMIWAAAYDSGYTLVWPTPQRRVVLRTRTRP